MKDELKQISDNLVIVNEFDYKCKACNQTFSGHSINFSTIPDWLTFEDIDPEVKFPQCPNCGMVSLTGFEEIKNAA